MSNQCGIHCVLKIMGLNIFAQGKSELKRRKNEISTLGKLIFEWSEGRENCKGN